MCIRDSVGTRKKHISKLSLKFIGIVILAAVVSASLFGFLFFNRYRMFHLAVGEEAVKKETSEQIQTLQDTITKKDISKKNKKAIKREMRKYKDLTLYLYDDEDTPVSYTHLDVYKRQVYSMLESQTGKFRCENLGFIFQSFNLMDTLTLKENIALPLTLSNMSKEEIGKRVQQTAERLELVDVLCLLYTSRNKWRGVGLTYK